VEFMCVKVGLPGLLTI